MLRLIAALSLVWLLMAVYTMAQQPSPVLDTNGRRLERGVLYYIRPAITDNGGAFTLINRNGSCPLNVGQENLSGPAGFPVKFTPFFTGERIIRESRDFTVEFREVATTCIQSTAWRLGKEDPVSKRRLIVTGGQPGYFRIGKNGKDYNLGWCPTDVCPTCKFRCGTAGILVENGKRLLALDGSVLPVVFHRA